MIFIILISLLIINNIQAYILDISRSCNNLENININNEMIYIYINNQYYNHDECILNIIYKLKKNKNHIICIAEYATEIYFTLFQKCDIRYVLLYSIIGQKYNKNMIAHYIFEANKLKLNIDTYINKIKNIWWLFDFEIIKNGAADKMLEYYS